MAFTDDELLDDLRAFLAMSDERGFAPSLREFQAARGFSSVSVAAYRLREMEFRNWLTNEPDTSRARTVTYDGRRAAKVE